MYTGACVQYLLCPKRKRARHAAKHDRARLDVPLWLPRVSEATAQKVQQGLDTVKGICYIMYGRSTQGDAMKNTWTKTRKRENAYHVGRMDSWTWYVLKVYSDPRKPYARAFCCVTSPIVGERGDVYANEVPGLIHAWEDAHADQA